MDVLLTNLIALTAYFGGLIVTPVALVKCPDVVARITAGRTVLAYADGVKVDGCTVADVLKAYRARKVTILDYGTSIVIKAKSSDYRFVVKS